MQSRQSGNNKNYDLCLSLPDRISQMAINFKNINDVPLENLFQVLSHSKCCLPSQKEFVDQVIQFFNDKDDKDAFQFLHLLSYIDFSLASLDQLRSLSQFDKCEIYEDLHRFLRIRESEENYNQRAQFLNSQNKKYVFNSMDFMNAQNHFYAVKDESTSLIKQIDQIQHEIGNLKNECKQQEDILKDIYNKKKHILDQNKLEGSNSSGNINALNQLLKTVDQESKHCDEEIKKLKSSIDEQKVHLDNIEKIKKIKKEYCKVCELHDELTRKYNAAYNTISSYHIPDLKFEDK